MNSTEFRQAAYQKLLDAKALEGENGEIPSEDQPRFEGLMGEFRDLDRQAGEAEKAEGKAANDGQSEMRERLDWYQQKATGRPISWVQQSFGDQPKVKSLGQAFVESKAYKELAEAGAFEGQDTHFRSPRVIVGSPRMGAAATDILQTETGGPAVDLVQPYRPGIMLPLPQIPTVIRDLFPNENMPSGDTIEYAAQIGFDNAAAAVAQATSASGSGLTGGVKPQSSIAWEERSSKATWIATWMAATRQALSDVTQLRSLIDNQGRLMIRLEEDAELMNGNGTAPNLRGIRNTSGIQTLNLVGSDNLDGVRTARRLVKTGLSRLDATFLVLNPEDSEEYDLLKDGMGLYRGGNPIGNFNFDQSIWRLRRVESESLAVGTALVGAGVAATVYERQPLSVLVADQHSDFFVRNLVVILFEERLAFPVYFPTAFVEITLSEWVS